MDDAFGNPLVIEVRDLLAEDKILQQGRAKRVGPERILIIGDRYALIGCQCGIRTIGDLVPFAAVAYSDFPIGTG